MKKAIVSLGVVFGGVFLLRAIDSAVGYQYVSGLPNIAHQVLTILWGVVLGASFFARD